MLHQGQKTKDVVEDFITITIVALPSILCERDDALTYLLLARESHVENQVQISPNLAKRPPHPLPISSSIYWCVAAALTGTEPRVLDVVADGGLLL
jgi:hypothetical protein